MAVPLSKLRLADKPKGGALTGQALTTITDGNNHEEVPGNELLTVLREHWTELEHP